MPKYLVVGVRTQEISVEVVADNEQDAIDIADMMPRNSIDVWDSTQLWHHVEYVTDESF